MKTKPGIPRRALAALGVALAVALPAFTATALSQADRSLPQGRSENLPEDRLAELVELCEGCHGPGGVSTREDVPSLAGRPADELFAEIERFYFYERICPDVPVDEKDAAGGHMSMCNVTNRMTREEGKALSSYFEAQDG